MKKSSWLVFGFLLMAAGRLSAQTAWTNTLGGNWSAPGNWNPNVVPGPGTNAFITNTFSSSYVITNDFLNSTLANLTEFNSGAGSVTLLNNTNGFNPTGNVIIGKSATFDLNSFAATFGGLLTVSNLGSVVVNGAQLTVGSTVTNGGTITLTNGGSLVSGTVTNGSLGVIRVLNTSGTIGGFLVNSGAINLSGVTTASGSAVLSLTNGGLNRASINITTNSILNIGGTDQSSANASLITFTNASTGTITFGRFTNTLNASTATVGIVNQGTIKNDQVAPVPISTINAIVVNDTGGQIATAASISDRMAFYAMPTNRGTISIGINATIEIQNGDLVNQGTVAFATFPANNFLILTNGTFLNDTSGLVTGDASLLRARSSLNNGTMILSNSSQSGLLWNFGGPVTNNGTIRIYRPFSSGFNDNTITATNFVNSGTITAVGLGTVMTNTLPVTSITSATTNLSSGTIVSSNGALLVFRGNFKNNGTLVVQTNSVLGVGAFLNTSEGAGKITAGLNQYQNDGTITLNAGTFAVARLTNAAGATLQGNGDIGRALFTNMISGSLTNFARQFDGKDIVNAGTIAPNGVLNAGNVTNLSGGQIIGSGSIQSVSVTNFYDGATFVTSNFNTGARIQNNAGATILASGGTLVLSNGFFNNTQAGTIGATNGGSLQLGDGTLALTNNGTVRLTGGQFVSGNLITTNGTVALASSTNGLFIAGTHTIASGSSLTASNTVGFVSGIITNLGTMQVVNSKMTYSNAVVISGRYRADPSTNTFVSDLTLSLSGTLEGRPGDLFDFQKSLFSSATNSALFNLASSTVLFSGANIHTNAVTGNDLGRTNESVFAAANFGYGVLKLGSSVDQIYFTNFVGVTGNTALYAQWLDLPALDTNLVANLHSPFNIYYAFSGLDANNAYLNDKTYALDGGGFLIPVIPEPSTLVYLSLTFGIFLRRWLCCKAR